MMLTAKGACFLQRDMPPVHPRLELVTREGTVLFVQDLIETWLIPGDSIVITWNYEGVVDPNAKPEQEKPGWWRRFRSSLALLMRGAPRWFKS